MPASDRVPQLEERTKQRKLAMGKLMQDIDYFGTWKMAYGGLEYQLQQELTAAVNKYRDAYDKKEARDAGETSGRYTAAEREELHDG